MTGERHAGEKNFGATKTSPGNCAATLSRALSTVGGAARGLGRVAGLLNLAAFGV
jgi:hypothetical protein